MENWQEFAAYVDRFGRLLQIKKIEKGRGGYFTVWVEGIDYPLDVYSSTRVYFQERTLG